MTTILSGGDPIVQRTIRRAYQILKTEDPSLYEQLKGTKMSIMLKAMSIAILEDLVNYNHSPGTLGAINLDNTTTSTLDPIPYDPDV